VHVRVRLRRGRDPARGAGRPIRLRHVQDAGHQASLSQAARNDTADTPRAYGSDRAARAPDGTFLLECPVEKTWGSRVAGSQTRSAHPGTAVEWEGEGYEVIAAETLAGAGYGYRLAPQSTGPPT